MLMVISIKKIRHISYDIAKANCINNRFSKDTQMAGKDWVRFFLK